MMSRMTERFLLLLLAYASQARRGFSTVFKVSFLGRAIARDLKLKRLRIFHLIDFHLRPLDSIGG